jgi:hypothetical protein
MSTKTNFKRVALVAVAALGLGVLTSVAPASAAVGTTSYEYSAANSLGVCAFGAETNNTTKLGEVLTTGVIALAEGAGSTLAGTLNDSLTVTVTGPAVLSGLTVDTDGSAAADVATVSYPTGSSVKFTATTTDKINLPQLLKYQVTGAGVIQISITKNVGGTSSDVEIYTFTASPTCVTGTASAANSIVKLGFYDDVVTNLATISTNTTSTSAATGTVAGGNYEYAASAARIANGGQALIGIRVKDGTSSATDVTTQGIFSASATAGAIVGFDAAGLALESSSTTTAGPTSGSAQNKTVYVKQGTANKNKSVSTVVSVYFNGVLYGTRSILFTGAAAKLAIDPASSSISKAADTGLAAIAYEITDAAGNLLTSDGTGVSGASSGGANNSPVVAGSGVVVDAQQAIVSSVSTPAAETSGAGTASLVCGSGSGSAKVYLKYVAADLSTLVSNQYDAACAYTAVNYKASLDKATYAPGEIATLTITATDKNGKPVYDVDSAGDGVVLGDTGADTLSISLPQLTAVSAPTNSDAFSGGKKSYKFTVGSTEGTFAGVVDLPLYNGTTYAQVAQTVSYKVAATTAGVTNADVLKAIVSLIASINKQIAALQKALLKK